MDYQSVQSAPYHGAEFPLKKLEPRDQKRIRRMAENGVRFVSGTISPHKASEGSLEDLKAAIVWAVGEWKTVTIQPKFMGSRCQVYFKANYGSDPMLISRNGFLIKDTAELLPSLHELWLSLPEDWKTKDLIIDGELMPWSFLGKGLVDDYKAIFTSNAVQHHSTKGFSLLHDKVITEDELSTYKQQLDAYTEDVASYFLPFNVLKIGDEIYRENQGKPLWAIINPEWAPLVFDITERAVLEENQTGLDDLVASLHTFESEHLLEGWVIKPLYVSSAGIPAIKVRNPNYLTLVYGPTYKRQLEALIAKKRTGKKVLQSILDHSLNYQLLQGKVETYEGLVRLCYDRIETDARL